MDFFDQQDSARRASRWLLLWYLLAILFVVLCFNLAVAVAYAVFALYGALPLAGGEPLIWRGLLGTYWHALLHVPPKVHYAVSAVVAAIILAVTAWRIWQLSEGGPVVAHMLGAHYLERGRATASEAKLLNVVEEMAIASGIAVPPVYLLASEDAINALVAGHSPSEAVIVATRGAVQKLSRDELQGVMGHEFSHILNGDMALNVRLVGLLAGIACFGEWGEALVLEAAGSARTQSREERGGGVLFAMFGAAIAFIGFPGLFAAEAFKAAISRQRELLADAASVQFTRNPEGIAGALDSISFLRAGTTLRAAHAVELSHMFFAPAVGRWWRHRGPSTWTTRADCWPGCPRRSNAASRRPKGRSRWCSRCSERMGSRPLRPDSRCRNSGDSSFFCSWNWPCRHSSSSRNHAATPSLRKCRGSSKRTAR